MTPRSLTPQAAYLVDPTSAETIDVLGPTVQLLTSPDDGDAAPLVMRGTLPSGATVPLHSHPDPETALAISGEAEGLVETIDGFEWVAIAPGDIFHIPGGARHAFRNRGGEPAVQIHLTTGRLGRFFREAGRPVAPGTEDGGLPTREAIEHFLQIAERYGHWIDPITRAG
jgi:quercetin dioxygenase-like cupin family protein